MHLRETIFCATAPASSSAGSGFGSVSLHDIQTGSSLVSFKQTSAGAHCTAFIESLNGQGGFILSAQSDKAILNVYHFQKDQIALKIVLPEKLTCLTVDRRGDFCAGGTSQGRIYLWEVASGILFNSWDAHYRQVNVLRFTQDGASLLSGSADSGVSVWSVSRLLDNELQNDLPAPYCTLSDHTLPVTDILCGVGTFPACRVLTASADHSVKLWDLTSSSLLTTFQFPHPIACLAWDVTERMFFAASAGSEASVHQVNLFRAREDRLGAEAVGGMGVADIIRVDAVTDQAKTKRLIPVGHPITCLALSLTSTLLLVGTTTGHVHTYDVASHQLIRTLTLTPSLPVHTLATMLRPPDLVGHVILGAGKEDLGWPVKPVAPFQRMRDGKAREVHEVPILLPVQPHDERLDSDDTYETEDLIKDHAFFFAPTESKNSAERVAELEREVEALGAQLSKAKGVNDIMWEKVVQRVIVGAGKTKADDGIDNPHDGDGGGERRRKRGRT